MNDFNAKNLEDFSSSGRERPWRKNKSDGLKTTNLYYALAEYTNDFYTKKGAKIVSCADTILFNVLADGSKRLYQTWFCKQRFCPMCIWRKSLKQAYQLTQVTDSVLTERPTTRFIFLTLTVPNVDGDELRKAVQRIQKGFDRLTKIRKVKNSILGYYKVFEVTYNKKTNQFHPHLHVLIAVRDDYFSQKNNDYISQTDWTSLWTTAMKSPVNLMVDVRAVKTDKQYDLQGAVREVAKYATKSSDVLKGTIKQQAHKLKTLTDELHGTRFASYGGVLREHHKRLHLEDVEGEDADLIHVGDGESDNVDAVNVEVYRWFGGIGGNYYLTPNAPSGE